MSRIIPLAAAILLATPALAQQAKSLNDLLRDNYAIVGTTQNSNWDEHFLYLRKNAEIYICIVASSRGRKGCQRVN